MAHKTKQKEMKVIEKRFQTVNMDLALSNIDESDNSITHQNKILACISSCTANHNGLVTTENEVNKLIANLKNYKKSLCSSLNLEIRLRKLTLDTVKTTCPLF